MKHLVVSVVSEEQNGFGNGQLSGMGGVFEPSLEESQKTDIIGLPSPPPTPTSMGLLEQRLEKGRPPKGQKSPA